MSENRSASLSFEQVKAHIQTYLKDLEENLLSPEDHTELYLLFVNCFQVKVSDCLNSIFRLTSVMKQFSPWIVFSQDSLWCSEAREVEQRRVQIREADATFLSRLVRKQTPTRREDPAEFLLNIARLRICLSSAAQQLEKAAIHGV